MGNALRALRWIALAPALAGILPNQYITSVRQIDITLTQGTSMAAAVSPDHRWIAFDLVGRLWLMPLGGGEARPITPMLLEARQPTWSPESDAIAFQGYDDGAWHIYVVSRDGGEPRALTTGEFDDREPVWSHQGGRIAFSSDRWGGITTIWTVDARSGVVRQVSKRDGAYPVWSPDDQEITMASADRVDGAGRPVAERERRPGLWGLRIDRGERLLAKATAALLPSAAGWSTDGTQLAFATSDAHLAVNGQIVSGSQDVFPFRPQWISPSELVYTADGHVMRWSPVGVSEIPFTATVSLRRPGYSIEARVPEAGDVRRKPVKGIVAPVVSPDGRQIAFVALGDLWVMPVGRDPVRITNDSAVELDPTWSPDGRQLAFSSDRTGKMELWVHDFAAGSDTQITHERGGVSGAAWSPDGSHITYVVDRRGAATVRVRPGDGMGGSIGLGQEIGRPTWSADSRSIAVGTLFPYSGRFREGLNQLLIRSFEFSSTTPRVLMPGHSAGNRQDNGPVWSPNGAEIAFVGEGKLWSVPVDASGGPTAPAFAVADDQPESPSWQGDSRHLVYLTPGGLKRVLADGGFSESIDVSLDWQPPAPPPRIIVHAGRLFDGVVEGLRSDVDIVVERGRIADIYAHRDNHDGPFIDARNEVVVPGFVEMHAHLDPDYGERFGKIWLAYGVTTVRIPAINPYAALELREAVDSGRRIGPRVFEAGDPFDGARIYYPGGVSVTSDGQLDRELDRARALDVDFFKTYVRLPDRLQQRVTDYAHSIGKPVTSHELFPAVAFGVDGVEHLRGTSRRGYSTKASDTNRSYQDVTEVIAKSGMTLTPTIGIQGGFAARVTGDKTLVFDRRLALFPVGVVGRLADLAGAPPDASLDDRIRNYEQTLKTIAAGGGRIIAGTDAPIDPYGLGLHVELEAYVHAGLTPFQALQAATINSARALGLEAHLGTIEPGKVADLTFLAGSPLDDIRSTRNVRRVMKGGRVYTLEELLPR